MKDAISPSLEVVFDANLSKQKAPIDIINISSVVESQDIHLALGEDTQESPDPAISSHNRSKVAGKIVVPDKIQPESELLLQNTNEEESQPPVGTLGPTQIETLLESHDEPIHSQVPSMTPLLHSSIQGPVVDDEISSKKVEEDSEVLIVEDTKRPSTPERSKNIQKKKFKSPTKYKDDCHQSYTVGSNNQYSSSDGATSSSNGVSVIEEISPVISITPSVSLPQSTSVCVDKSQSDFTQVPIPSHSSPNDEPITTPNVKTSMVSRNILSSNIEDERNEGTVEEIRENGSDGSSNGHDNGCETTVNITSEEEDTPPIAVSSPADVVLNARPISSLSSIHPPDSANNSIHENSDGDFSDLEAIRRMGGEAQETFQFTCTLWKIPFREEPVYVINNGGEQTIMKKLPFKMPDPERATSDENTVNNRRQSTSASSISANSSDYHADKSNSSSSEGRRSSSASSLLKLATRNRMSLDSNHSVKVVSTVESNNDSTPSFRVPTPCKKKNRAAVKKPSVIVEEDVIDLTFTESSKEEISLASSTPDSSPLAQREPNSDVLPEDLKDLLRKVELNAENEKRLFLNIDPCINKLDIYEEQFVFILKRMQEVPLVSNTLVFAQYSKCYYSAVLKSEDQNGNWKVWYTLDGCERVCPLDLILPLDILPGGQKCRSHYNGSEDSIKATVSGHVIEDGILWHMINDGKNAVKVPHCHISINIEDMKRYQNIWRITKSISSGGPELQDNNIIEGKRRRIPTSPSPYSPSAASASPKSRIIRKKGKKKTDPNLDTSLTEATDGGESIEKVYSPMRNHPRVSELRKDEGDSSDTGDELSTPKRARSSRKPSPKASSKTKKLLKKKLENVVTTDDESLSSETLSPKSKRLKTEQKDKSPVTRSEDVQLPSTREDEIEPSPRNKRVRSSTASNSSAVDSPTKMVSSSKRTPHRKGKFCYKDFI